MELLGKVHAAAQDKEELVEAEIISPLNMINVPKIKDLL